MSGALLLAALVLAQAPAARAPQLTRAPEVLESATPIYPEDALKERREGTVELEVSLSADGVVHCVAITESAGVDLDWAALGALTQFRFSPAEMDGKPSAVTISYRMAFALPRAAETPPAAVSTNARAFTLQARVRAAGSVRPVPFAEVVLTRMPPGSAAPETLATDIEGRFAVTLEEGPWEVSVATQGFEAFTSSQWLAGGTDHQMDIALRPLASNRFETVLQARRGEPPVSRVSLSRAEVTGVPGTYGDALRVLESLPGVARAPLLGGALMVRGGYPADTQVHFEGVPIPVLYHFGGFTSVINGAFVEEIQFMAGGFPSRYGNATAGIVDVRAHALDNETPEAHLDVDIFDVGAFLGGAVRPVEALPALRFGFAARRSHAEVPGNLALTVLSAIGQPIPFLPVPVYSDYQLKLQTDFGASSRLSFFMFGAEDQWAVLGDQPLLGTALDGEDLNLEFILNRFLSNRFHRALVSWELRLAPGLTSTFRPWIGTTRRGLLSEGVAVPLLTGGTVDSPAEETNFGLRQEVALKPAPWWRSLVGLEVNGALSELSVLPGDEVFEGPNAEGFIVNVDHRMVATALYAETSLALTPSLSVTPGARLELSSMRFDAPAGVDIYAGSSSSLVRSLTFDPRVQLRFMQTRDLTWKVAFGTFHQRPRVQSAAYDNDGVPLASPGSLQVIGGFEAKLFGPVSLDAQVYGTRRTGLVRDRSRFYDPANTQPFAPIAIPGSFDSYGSGDTGGFEMMLRHAATEHFFGWISYTYSRTVVSLRDKREDEVPFPFDQTHNLVLVGRINLPWELTFGGRFAFVTGNPGPISDAVTTEHNLRDNTYTPVLSSLRSPRLPPFHRLDLRLDRRFVFSWATLVPFLEVINVYNYPNPEVVYPGGDYRARDTLILLPNPPLLPLVGVELDL